MGVVMANIDHVDYISEGLSEYFSRINESYGFKKFKTDKNLMIKYVSKRVESDEGGFIYFISKDEDDRINGFVNLLIDEQRIGSILVLVGDDDSVLADLIAKAREYFKEHDIENVYGEYFVEESGDLSVLRDLGMETKIVNYKLVI